jgi:hypothetical protein
MHFETVGPVLKKDLEGKAAHKHFDELMKFVESHNGKVPFQSGDDDDALHLSLRKNVS